ncbi:MAG: hypothetical protein NTW50_03070 [Candidatus Berkelbacteria bacterium]|nr:hypothetical protein [Candidatus Berkelbacteria bacterium]
MADLTQNTNDVTGTPVANPAPAVNSVPPVAPVQTTPTVATPPPVDNSASTDSVPVAAAPASSVTAEPLADQSVPPTPVGDTVADTTKQTIPLSELESPTFKMPDIPEQAKDIDNEMPAETPLPPLSDIAAIASPADQASVPAPIDEEMADLSLFRDRLIQDLGMEDISAERKKVFADKLEQLVNDRILNLIILYLPPEKVAGFADVMESGDVAKSMEYASSNIPSFSDKIIEELAQIRTELLTSYNSKNE